MTPDLVHHAGFDFDFNVESRFADRRQVEDSAACEDWISAGGALGHPCAGFDRDHALRGFRVVGEWEVDEETGLEIVWGFRFAGVANERSIDFSDLSFAPKRAQSFEFGLAFGEDQESARAGVEAMQDGGFETAATDRLECGQIRKCSADGGSCFFGGLRDGWNARVFVQDQEFVVFVDDRKEASSG